MISRQPCQWDIPLDQVLETEIELEEKPKLDHSFVSKTNVDFLLRHVEIFSLDFYLKTTIEK